MSANSEKRISYFELLPLVYQRKHIGIQAGKQTEETNDFLQKFLKSFEGILFGENSDDFSFGSEGLVEILQSIHSYFDPQTTPDEFVDWLSGWVALDLSREVEKDNDSDERELEGFLQILPFQDEQRGRKRYLIKQLAPIYHLRGTKEGLRQIIDIFFGDDLRGFQINELIKPYVIGDPEGLIKVRSDYLKRKGFTEEEVDFEKVDISDLLVRENYDALGSVVGRSTVVGEAPAYYFIIVAETLLPMSYMAADIMKRELAFIIDMEKPAHSYYTQKLKAPGMRVGVRDWCDLGKSTLIKGFEI